MGHRKGTPGVRHRDGTPGWDTGGGTGGGTPGRATEATGGGETGKGGPAEDTGKPRRGPWTEENCRETSQRTLDRGELQESAPEGPARHTRSAPRAHLESHRHFAYGKAPAAVGYDRNFPAGSVPDIQQVIHEGVGVTAYDKVKPAGLRHEGDVVLIAKV